MDGMEARINLVTTSNPFFEGGSSRGIASFRVFEFDSLDSARFNGRADGDSVAMIQIPICRREIRAKESQVLAGATRNRPPLPPESGIPSFFGQQVLSPTYP